MKKKGDLADPLEGFETFARKTLQKQEEEAPEEPQEQETQTPHIETHTETKSLKCILTDEERRQCGERMARALNVKNEAVGTMKSVSDQYKAEISKAEAEMAGEASKINSGYEFRTVEINVEFDYSQGTVVKTRKDTAEIIEMRRMTGYEAQRNIKF